MRVHREQDNPAFTIGEYFVESRVGKVRERGLTYMYKAPKVPCSLGRVVPVIFERTGMLVNSDVVMSTRNS